MWPFKSREPFHQIKKTSQKLGDAPADYFVSSGLDFKGQAQMAYEAQGYGLGADFSIDAGKLLGFLELGVGVSAAVNRANGVMIVAQRGADHLNQYSTGLMVEVPRPILLSSMMGVLWEGKVGVSFDIGVGFEASAGVGLGSKGGEASAGTKSSFKEGDDEDEGPISLEAAAIGVSLEGRVGFGASASYTYQNLYLEDVSPLYYGSGDRAQLRADIDQIFRNGSNKTWVKEAACQFLTANSRLGFKALSYKGLVFNTASKDIYEALAAGSAALSAKASRTPAEAAALAEAANWLARLRPYLGGAVSSGVNKLHLTSHSPAGEAGFRASLELKAGAGAIGELAAAGSIQGPSIAISGKRAGFRYQTAWEATSGARFMTTQDTVLSYTAFERTLYAIKGEASASSGLAGRQKSVETSDPRLESKVAVQRLSYVSSTITWEQPNITAALARTKEATASVRASAPALFGSGLAFGQSCVVKSLTGTYGAIDPDKGGVLGGAGAPGKYLVNLARALRIPLRTLTEFLMLRDVYEILRDLSALKETSEEAARRLSGASLVGLTPQQIEARRQQLTGWLGGENESPVVLIEASFAAPGDFAVDLEVKRSQQAIGRVESCELARDTRSRLLQHADVQDEAKRRLLLQSLRLRWRIQDEKTRDAEAFALGFKILGSELKVGLSRVDRATSEGIVDLAVVWVQGGALVTNVNTANAYNNGVPAVTLFCQ